MRKYLLIATAIFILDRLLKILSANTPGKIFLLPGVVFDYHINYGIIFSWSVPMLPVIIISAVFLAVILAMAVSAYRKNEPVIFFGWTLIIFGAVSNFLDRIIYRGTVDYVNILASSLVNVADGMILAGIIILILKFRNAGNAKGQSSNDKSNPNN